MRYHVILGGRSFEVDLTGPRPKIDGQEVDAELAHLPGGALYNLHVDGASVTLSLRRLGERGEWDVAVGGHRLQASAIDERTRAIREMTGGHETARERTVTAPMPGLVVRLEVEQGQQVKAGQGVVIVEAMKMENELKAPADGTVARIEVQAGQTVEKGAVLLVLE